MYWRTPDVGHVNVDRTFNISNKNGSIYEFIYNNKDKKFSELKDLAIEFFNKENNPKYFGQIVTYMNFLGLIEVEIDNDGKEIVKRNSLLEKIFIEFNRGNEELAIDYMNYYLCKWQFPMVNTNEHREDEVSKPYVVILSILLKLRERDLKEAYLTQFDFYRLFNLSSIDLDSIDDDFIDDILANRTKEVIPKDKIGRATSYYTALLKNSSLITTLEDNYDKAEWFMFGIVDKEWCIEVAKYIIYTYKEIKFEFDRLASASDKVLISKWAKYINNEDEFYSWRREVKLIKDINKFQEFCLKEGYSYSIDLIRRFILSLETKQFLILTGISGSGKTKIAELWGKYKGQCLLKAIGSNWNDNKKLIGFKNLLVEDNASYIKTDIVKFIEESNKFEGNEYILILDEMNLSHVERYFSDFLSALESIDKEIILPSGEKIILKNNLKIIGTVNVDETTYMFSPKVLDRANVIEMNGSRPSEFIKLMIDYNKMIFVDIKDKLWLNDYLNILDKIYDELNGKFGYRVIEEITKYMLLNTKLYGDEMFSNYLDEQIYQKILPKLHGTRAMLSPKLKSINELLNEEFILTKNKIEKMLKDAEKGYTSFIGE